MPWKGDYHGTSDVDYYRKRIGIIIIDALTWWLVTTGKNEIKQNKMHLKAEKRRKEISESSSYKVSGYNGMYSSIGSVCCNYSIETSKFGTNILLLYQLQSFFCQHAWSCSERNFVLYTL